MDVDTNPHAYQNEGMAAFWGFSSVRMAPPE
jgi:hypothetical protein